MFSTHPEPSNSRGEGNFSIDAAAVLECTTDCVIVFDRAWRFIYINERAKAMIGVGREFLGRNVWREFPRRPGDAFEQACRKAMADRFPVRCEEFHAPLGMWFENSIFPCGDGIAIYFRDVTEQKHQKQALRESEEQSRQQLAELESIYASAPVGLAVISPDLHIIRVNQRMAEIDGHSVAAHIGKTVRDMVPELADLLEATARSVFATGEPVQDLEVEGETSARPGVPRTWIAQWFPQKDAAGNVVSINVVAEDVTDRKRIERELRDKAEELEAVLNAVPAAVWLAHDPECRNVASNQAGLDMLRAPPGTNVSKTAENQAAVQHFRVLRAGVEIPSAELPLQKAAATGEEVRGFEETIAFDDGDIRHIYGNTRPLFDASGKTRGAVGAFVDVTEVVEAREANLRRHDELERLVAERTADRDRLWHLSSDLMLTVTFDGVIKSVNPAWTTVLGWTERELIGRSRFDFIHPDDHARTARAATLLAEGATLQHFENRYRHKDGDCRWIAWTAVAGDGVVNSVGRDVTAEKAKTEALEASVARMRAIFETSYQYHGMMTTDGILLDANPTSLAGIEARLEDVVGKPFWQTPWFTGTPGMPEQVKAAIPLVASGQTVRQEIVVNLPTGRRAFDFAMRPVFNTNGEVIAIVPEAIELTERRAAEEQLRQVQKMEAVGQLTGGIAHDFNNLLAAITGSLELLGMRLAQGRTGELDRYVTAAQAAARRAAALTHRLLAFSRRQILDARATDINRLVAGMEELIRRTVGPEITIEAVAVDAMWSTWVDQNQLENALLNLCINARDAMPAGGRLTIATANMCLDGRAALERDLPPGEYVSLCVGDTGIGMTEEVIARAFDPFFTTKAVGEGTGLGLSMIYGFVQQSGGQARIYSELGQGTRVCLYLPRHAGAEDDTERSTGAAEMPRAEPGETVLVVDDEPIVRMLITDVLRDLGYTAIDAEDGAAGLKVVESDGRIDLMIADVGLPGGTNGRQLADAARLVRPALKVLFITGYAENAMLGDGRLEPGMHVLNKPFVFDALASRIKDIMSGG
jgi:PAS domain S-box-containing protein